MTDPNGHLSTCLCQMVVSCGIIEESRGAHVSEARGEAPENTLLAPRPIVPKRHGAWTNRVQAVVGLRPLGPLQSAPYSEKAVTPHCAGSLRKAQAYRPA